MVVRTTQLNDWVKSLIPNKTTMGITLTPISGDASFRHYYRVITGTTSYIAVDANPERENNRQFVAVSRMLDDNGINVPRVIHQDLDQGFMLLSDLGDDLYYTSLISAPDPGNLYLSAINRLIQIQLANHSSCVLPVFDADFILRELSLFHEWFICGLLGLQAYPDFASVSNILVDHALEQPQVFMHRDYHSRNLMITDSNNPGVLDFQDAVIGPVSYDLASLLKDCYVSLSPDQITHLVTAYLKEAEAAGVIQNIELHKFIRWFDLIALQRHLKCAGIFSRLYLRDGKITYLQDIPTVINYVSETTSQYAEFALFNEWLSEIVRPCMDASEDLFTEKSGDPS